MFLSAQVGVSFSLSLELLSYQKLPADQMLPGVVIQQSASGEKEMVFTQDLLLQYANHTTQVSPGPAPHATGVELGWTLSLWGQRTTNPNRALRNKRSPSPCLGRGLAHGKVRVIHLYLT